MIEVLPVLIALLTTEEDEDQRIRILIGIIAAYFHIQQINRLRTHSNRKLRLLLALVGTLRNDPSGALCPEHSTIYKTIYNEANDLEFKQQFRMSRPAFEALVTELSPWIKTGKSRNKKQNICARMKIGIALYFFAHGGSGQNLGNNCGMKKSAALKYVHQVAGLICRKLSHKWMGDGIFNGLPNYMEECRARFHARHGFPNVGGCIDGTHIPYNPNSGECEEDFKNYKNWTSMLCIAFVNSFYLFVDMDVGWPGRYHDKTCTENSHLWSAMHVNREKWVGKDGVALTDSAWGHGSELVMCPYTAADGNTAAQQWYNFVHSSTRFFVEQTFGMWKNRFRCLLTPLCFSNKCSQRIIFATAVLHNICTLVNDLDESFYFDGTDHSSELGFPPSPLALYTLLFPIDKVICPRCKRKSNGAIPSNFRCTCNVVPLQDRAGTAFLARHPDLRAGMLSPDPIVRRDAYRNLMYHFKPKNF